MSEYISDIVNNWSDRKLQKNTLILTEIYPLKGETSVDLPDFKKDKNIRVSIVKVSLRLLGFFGYSIRERYSLQQIKPILREEKGVVVGLCNKKNIELITRILKFFGENNMGILSGIFCLAICKALQDCSNFRQVVWDNKVLRTWLKTQKYLTEGNISQLHRKYFKPLEDAKGHQVKSQPVDSQAVASQPVTTKPVTKPDPIERTYSQSSASSDGEGPQVKKPRENALSSLYEKGGRYEGLKERMKILDDMFPASSEEEDEPEPVPPIKKAKFKNVEKKVEQKKVLDKKVAEKKVVEKKYPTFECNICASEKNTSQKVACPKCKFECCKTCLKRHLLSSSKLNPSCMNCNTALSLDFVYDNTDEGFYNKEYREHRAGIILSMEKSLLPTTQEDANIEAKQREEKEQRDIIKKWPKDAKKKAEYYRDKNRVYFNQDNPEKAKEYMDKFFDINNRMFAFDDVKRNMYRGFHLERFKYIMDESKPFILEEFRRFFDRPVPVNDRSFIHLQDILRGRERGEGGQQEKKTEMPKRLVFIGPCPAQDCKGYLDENYVCGLCKKEACKNCRLPKHTDKCNPDIVATVKMMDRETKRCPKCNVPIYKTEGCDQMWCPSCHTAFSWVTGEIETGRIHNPHYYQWMREQGGGQMAREQGDVRCGGAVLYRDLLDTLRRLRLPRYEELLAKLHSLIGDIRGVQLRRLVVNNDPDVNRDLRINYLLGDYKNDKEWLSKIKMREKSKEKRTSEILILQMLADTLEVILENIYRATSKGEVDLQLAQLPELHTYVNKEFIKIEKRFKNKSFYLNDWRFDFRSKEKRTSAIETFVD
jgi:hypothetical protein